MQEKDTPDAQPLLIIADEDKRRPEERMRVIRLSDRGRLILFNLLVEVRRLHQFKVFFASTPATRRAKSASSELLLITGC